MVLVRFLLNTRRAPAGQPEARLNLLVASLAGASALFLLINTVALALARPRQDASIWVSLAVWAGCWVAGEAWLNRVLPARDRLLFPLVMFLSGWGLVIIERVAPEFSERQTLWLIIGVAALAGATALPNLIALLRRLRYTLLAGGLLLLVATIMFGTHPSGIAGAPALWLWLGGLFVQPSEPLKIILVVFLASYLSEQFTITGSETARYSASPGLRALAPVLLMWGLSLVVLVWQRDLGTAALFFLVFLTLLYVASGRALVVVGGAALALVAGAAAYGLFSVVQIRVDAWVNPWPQADGSAYQLVQSLMAFAAGGIFGQGIGTGLPTAIPVIHSDFIFAALAEEWGLVGVITAIVVVAVLCARGLRAAVSLPPFPALLAVGLSATLAIQSILIIGGVLKILPLTGVTVPFLSYGGSSLVTSMVMVGLLIRLSIGDSAHAVSA